MKTNTYFEKDVFNTAYAIIISVHSQSRLVNILLDVQ